MSLFILSLSCLYLTRLNRTHEVEEKYYADGEDAFAMRKQLREVKEKEPKKLIEGGSATSSSTGSEKAVAISKKHVEQKPKEGNALDIVC